MIPRRVFLASLFAAPLAAAESDLRWLPTQSAELEIDGLPWLSQNGGELSRLPSASQDKFPRSVWNLAQSPSGARIRFRTDAATVAIRVEYPSPPDMANMHAFGQTGVDLYMDGSYRGTAIADKEAKPGKVYEKEYFRAKPRACAAEALPSVCQRYKPVKVIAVGVDRDARFEKARSFAVAKPVVFYVGTSITQGGCASRRARRVTRRSWAGC